MNICDYTTVTKAKAYSDITTSGSDALILDFIRQASREIEDITNRRFYPLVETHIFDTPRTPDLVLDDDLLAVSSLTNGDGSAIASGDYRTYPLNKTPKYKVTLLGSARQQWLADSYGNREGAISLAGYWGCSDNYASAWQDVGAALSAAIGSAGVTTFTVTTGKLLPGMLVQIDTEMLYASAVSTGTSDTVTVNRGVNGSTAATHLINAAVLIWTPGLEIESLVRRAAAAYTKLRANPLGETINVDGLTFSTPRDVLKWMDQQLKELGYIRTGMA